MFSEIDIEIIIGSAIIVLLIINIFLIYTSNKSSSDTNEQFERNRDRMDSISKENRKDLQDTLDRSEGRISKILDSINTTLEKQLNEIKSTVDEKLQTTLEKKITEEYKKLQNLLLQVSKDIGEMQDLASGVGDLKNILTNVKSKGVFGEYQLENILDQLLTPDQYSKNVATKRGSSKHVEFAVKLPGNEVGDEVWLPIDSKFPSIPYENLMKKYDEGSKEEVDKARTFLGNEITKYAKDIAEKYLDPPNTTNFGILFLPTEGLYAEVLRTPGFIQKLQKTHRITIAGPTTLSAFLNSLQMGFTTLRIQKQSGVIEKVLHSIKDEFEKFATHLDGVATSLSQATTKLDALRSTRTNVMTRKLQEIDRIDSEEVSNVLMIEDNNDAEDN